VRSRTRGFSLVELMVAITLSLALGAAVISVFVGSHSAYKATSGVGALADSGRFALDTIQESARGAGFMECNHATSITSQVILNSLASPFAYDFRYGVGGSESTGTSPGNNFTLATTPVADTNAADWLPALGAAFTPAVNQQVKGSDVLVFRSSVPRGVPSYVNADVANGANSFVVSQANTLQAGSLAVISDCAKSIAFQVGSVAGAGPATVTLAGATGVPGNSLAALPFGFSRGALVSALTTVVYYVGLGADGYSALKRLEILNGQVNGAQIFTDEEIAPNVENLQVLYGIDTNGTKVASAYVTADQVTNWDSVVSVRVAVLSASPAGAAPKPATALTFNMLGTTVKAPIDTRQRKVFDMTITMRNAVE
jgi:type IV pilus assembly protein PilW